MVSLAADVRLDGEQLVRGTVAVSWSDPVLLSALQAGVAAQDLVSMPDGPARSAVRQLQASGFLAWTVPDLARAEALAPGTSMLTPVRRPGTLRLSRWALLRRDEAGWLAESGVSPWRVRLTPSGADVVVAGTDPDGWLAGLLHGTHLLDDADDDAAAWTFADRFFQSRSRGDLIWDDLPKRRDEPEPALRTYASPGLALPRPTGPTDDEPTMWAATQRRRTVRSFANTPVPLAALGALLWRTVRVQSTRPRDPDDPQSYEVTFRPVPSGGAMHAYDLWLVCSNVQDLTDGTYAYDPAAHALHPIAQQSTPHDLVLARFAQSGQVPPVVGLLTVRHARTAWKYDHVALSLELKDVGVIMEALQITAGALGLGVCPWGKGPTALIAALIGVDPLVDAPVGEFVLGVAP